MGVNVEANPLGGGFVASLAADASGEGPIGVPRSVTLAADAIKQPGQARLEDRGVRGAILCISGDRTQTQIDLPLSFASIEREGATLSITVHKDVHPDCEHGGKPICLTCTEGAAEAAESWKREMEQAIEKVDTKHWGASKSFIREQRDRWAAEGERCKGMSVAEYFIDIGLGHVYDDTWSWCAGVLEGLEAKESKSVADAKEIAYYRRKVEKTEVYEDMELTDYMNILKHRDLVPAKRMVSYADFIHAEVDSTGRRKVSEATVFVSHVWKMTTKDFFEVCLAEMAEEDYAWIDLYLHNQYQGAVSAIGDENSEYWVKKFGELIGGIGKVIAIVTDWESPVMLTRIWCLFELNAAIDTGAELRFVASSAQRMDLMLNLQEKFKYMSAIVQNIEVRNCDAKRPHEIQDKAVFLSKLAGVEDEVNDKLRKAMQLWLAETAQGVLARSDPSREPLGPAEIELEIAQNQVRWCICCCPMTVKVTRLLERWPRLPMLLLLLGVSTMLATIGMAAKWGPMSTYVISGSTDSNGRYMSAVRHCHGTYQRLNNNMDTDRVLYRSSGNWYVADISSLYGFVDKDMDGILRSSSTESCTESPVHCRRWQEVYRRYSSNDFFKLDINQSQRLEAECDGKCFVDCIGGDCQVWRDASVVVVSGDSWYGAVALVCCIVSAVLLFLGLRLRAYQLQWLLRQVPLLGDLVGRHRVLFVVAMALLSIPCFPLLLWYGIMISRQWANFFGLVMASIFSLAVWSMMDDATRAAATRASLASKVGWLQLKLGDVEAAEQIFRSAHNNLLRLVGHNDPEHSYIVAPGLVRSLSEQGKELVAKQLAVGIEAAECNSVNRCTQLAARWSILRIWILCWAAGTLGLLIQELELDAEFCLGIVLITMVTGLFASVPLAVACTSLGRGGQWMDRGPLLRARMAAAACSPDAEVLALLAEVGTIDGAEARRRGLGRFHILNEEEPEWDGFRKRMDGSRGEREGTLPENRVAWEDLPPLMRSAGDNALSPWVKYTHLHRSYYKRDNPIQMTLKQPLEGVWQEPEIGMPDLVMIGEWWWWRKLADQRDMWEIEYAELGGPDCWTKEQIDQSKRRMQVRILFWITSLSYVLGVLVCSALLYVDCGYHGHWGFGSCTCADGFTRERCDLPPIVPPWYDAEAKGMADAYLVSGHAPFAGTTFNGRYERVAPTEDSRSVCMRAATLHQKSISKPVYQLVDQSPTIEDGLVLFQGSGGVWYVGNTVKEDTSEDSTIDCRYSHDEGSTCVCNLQHGTGHLARESLCNRTSEGYEAARLARPDSIDGCTGPLPPRNEWVGAWREWTGSSWVEAPMIVVTPIE